MAVDNVARGLAAKAMSGGGGTPGSGEVKSVNGKTGVVILSARDVGALPDSTNIPTQTSDLKNDSGFLTQDANNLRNYYPKSETMSKTEIEGIVGNIDAILGTI